MARRIRPGKVTKVAEDEARSIMKKTAALLLALALTQTACHHRERDEVLAQYSQGNYLLAFEKLEFMARRGDAVAEYATGYMLFYGVGIAKDEGRALDYFRKSAQQGYPEAVAALKMIVEDHPNMRVEEHGRRKPYRYNVRVDDGRLLQDIPWIRERNPRHFTIRLQAQTLTDALVNALTHDSDLQFAAYRDVDTTSTVIGDFTDEREAMQALASLDSPYQKSAAITTFGEVQQNMMPE